MMEFSDNAKLAGTRKRIARHRANLQYRAMQADAALDRLAAIGEALG